MGKGSDLWDDSALVDAFHHAVATYKKMHKASYQPDSYEDNRTTTSNTTDANTTEDCEPVPEEISTREVKHENAQDNALQVSSRDRVPLVNETTSESSESKKDYVNGSLCAKEPDPQFLEWSVDHRPEENGYYSGQQSAEYNSLLNQYYEIEEQRQKVLHQLQQLNYSGYINPVETADYTWQQVPESNVSMNGIQVSENNTSGNGVQQPLSTCSCHCVAVQVAPISSCGVGGIPCGVYEGCQPMVQRGPCSTGISCTMEDAKKSVPVDDNIVKVGMLAAERAISAMRTEMPSHDKIIEGKGKDKEGTTEHENMTDLTAVLSAWYSAGFQTGRYLSEMHRRQDKTQ